MNNELNLLYQQISATTVSVAKALIGIVDNYLNEFNKADFLTFTKSKNQSEKYLNQYHLFLTNISPMITELTSTNARLASLLIKADKAMDVETVVLCERCFAAFEEFERNMHEYTIAMESLFEGSSATATSITKLTQRLKNAIERLIEANI